MYAEDWWIVGIFAALIAAMALALLLDARERDAFMDDCLKDRKAYECTAMWRAGDSHTTVMPVVVPIR